MSVDVINIPMGPKFEDLILSFLQEAHQQHPDLLDIESGDAPEKVTRVELFFEFDDDTRLVDQGVQMTYQSREGWFDQYVYSAPFSHLVYDLSQV